MTKSFFQEYDHKIKRLKDKFPGYYPDITESRIKDFIKQFNNDDYGLALKTLEKTRYFSNSKIIKYLRLLTNVLQDEIDLTNTNVYFCSMSISSGKSTDAIIGKIRKILNMNKREFDWKYLHLRDLENLQNDSKHKTIIFADDFIGSGSTIQHLWSTLQNWYNSNHEYYVGVIIGYENIINNIESLTPLKIRYADDLLTDNDRIFHEDNIDFSEDEKKTLKKYCRLVEKRKEYQYGFRNSQSLIIFSENAPNNAIPILHKKSPNWVPLFPRL